MRLLAQSNGAGRKGPSLKSAGRLVGIRWHALRAGAAAVSGDLAATGATDGVRRRIGVDQSQVVIPGRCEASNPESRGSGFGSSSRPGTTTQSRLFDDRMRN